MIGWLKGEIIDKQAPELLLDVNGVGYEVHAPMTTFFQLPEKGAVELFIHHVVREDAQQLFGFASKHERSLFRSLIKVNGVGPKLGLAILSSIDADSFVRCVQNDDVNALVKIPGIGKKTAERLLIEMRDRLKDWYLEGGSELPAETGVSISVSNANVMVKEAESALIALGYKPQEASRYITAVNSEDITSAEGLIKAALKQLA